MRIFVLFVILLFSSFDNATFAQKVTAYDDSVKTEVVIQVKALFVRESNRLNLYTPFNDTSFKYVSKLQCDTSKQNTLFSIASNQGNANLLIFKFQHYELQKDSTLDGWHLRGRWIRLVYLPICEFTERVSNQWSTRQYAQRQDSRNGIHLQRFECSVDDKRRKSGNLLKGSQYFRRHDNGSYNDKG